MRLGLVMVIVVMASTSGKLAAQDPEYVPTAEQRAAGDALIAATKVLPDPRSCIYDKEKCDRPRVDRWLEAYGGLTGIKRSAEESRRYGGDRGIQEAEVILCELKKCGLIQGEGGSDRNGDANDSPSAKVSDADVLAGFFPIKKGAWWQYHCQILGGKEEGTVILKTVSVVKTITSTKAQLAIVVKECSGGLEEQGDSKAGAKSMVKDFVGEVLPVRLIIDSDGIRGVTHQGSMSKREELLQLPFEDHTWSTSIGDQKWNFNQQIKRSDDGSYLESRVEGAHSLVSDPAIAQVTGPMASTETRILAMGKGLIQVSEAALGKITASCNLEDMGVAKATTKKMRGK